MPSRKKLSVKPATKHTLLARTLQQELLIERLKTEVKGLEASLRNMHMVYDICQKNANRAVEEKIDALVSLREAHRLADRACSAAEKSQDDLCVYQSEGAIAMWFRSMRTALSPITTPLSNLVKWITSKVKRNDR